MQGRLHKGQRGETIFVTGICLFFFILQKALSVVLVGGGNKKRKTCIVSVFGVTSKKGQCFNSGEMMGGNG